MTVTVETLEKLERRITLTVSTETINGEINGRLKEMSRTAKVDGFRPGKVPLSVMSKRFGRSVENEVVHDKLVGEQVEGGAEKGRTVGSHYSSPAVTAISAPPVA